MQNIKNYRIKLSEKKKIADQFGLNKNKNSFNIRTKHALILVKKLTTNLKIKEELSKFSSFSSKIKNYKYFRNLNGYPSRGQRTHTNAKTKKKIKFKSIF
jgi:ribosomal protein S13